ncbi:UNVERIFIED_CONTAM: hypothetical protein Sradi_6425200 [Sesamum radiatum]|uniref:Retrovirus-related Pol polyprotein from transposon TNT 1-94-like beta-barrel domain-containing protein n=1 Tax=Sesamum radiatum TaxID=300843 RepID=A0AAW2K3P4_SESRA
MQEGSDLAQRVNVFNQIITNLARLDVSIEDEDRAIILLCSLLFSYEHLVTTLTYGKEMIKNDNSNYSDGDMLFVSTNQYVDAWILDSGCSYHMTPNREWFTSYRSGNSGSIYLGDDRCCNIAGISEVRIKMYERTVRTLYDVRYILDLKKNLISMGSLHKNGFIPKADEDREIIRIVKGALTVMKGKIIARSIYKLLGNTVVDGVQSVDSCDDNTKLWHMCLGHLNERG